jgi:hypothetical protein
MERELALAHGSRLMADTGYRRMMLPFPGPDNLANGPAGSSVYAFDGHRKFKFISEE